MSSLIPFSDIPGGLSVRQERQLERQKAQIHARGSLIAAREIAKVSVVTDVTEEALMAASEVAQLTGMLVQRTPHAEAALNHIASAGITAMADVVIRAGRSLR